MLAADHFTANVSLAKISAGIVSLVDSVILPDYYRCLRMEKRLIHVRLAKVRWAVYPS